MIAGLLAKTARETRASTLLFALGLLLAELVLTTILPQMAGPVSQVWGQLPFVRVLVGALLGLDPEQDLTFRVLQALLWVHPIVLALVWGHAIGFATRFPAGEVERGTIDVLLGWPVSRRAVWLAEGLACLASGMLVLACGLLGHRLAAGAWEPAQRLGAGALAGVGLNLLALYLAVAGLGTLVASLCDRRGRAVAWVLAFVLASFLLDFAARFFEPARAFAFLGVLRYYRPTEILADGGAPLVDVAVLLGFGTVAWLAGGAVTVRRSLRAT